MTDPAVHFAVDDEIDPETDAPLQITLFSNYNNQATLDADGSSLVGRFAISRGAVQKIVAVAPLQIDEITGALIIDGDNFQTLIQSLLTDITIDGGTF